MNQTLRLTFLLALCATCAFADVYMHSPRGSNDRNCERNVNRNNGNRLFDSQNNAKGGYACPRAVGGPEVKGENMYYYQGSVVAVQWTAQHGCGGNSNTHCEVVLQYMCEDSNPKIRDGTPRDVNDAATDTIPENAQQTNAKGVPPNAPAEDDQRYGYHETHDWYKECKTRSRNRGLFTADRNLRKADSRSTRQNENGNRRGLECPEERDYYPYWSPTPWKDIAVLVDDESRCKWYQDNSNNVKKYGTCNFVKPVAGIAKDLSIGLWNAQLQTFLRMHSRAYFDQNRDTDGKMDSRWTWELFKIIPAATDGGVSKFALWSQVHKRYVRVQHLKGGTLVSRGKPTTQSSTAYRGDSNRAVDGKTDRNYGRNSCTHTKNGDQKPWWSVDLQREYPISSIKIWNRDSAEDRLSGFKIMAGATECGQTTREGVQSFDCNGAKADNITIVRDGSGTLTLCEVEVFTSQKNAPGSTNIPDEYKLKTTGHLGSWDSIDPKINSELQFEAVKVGTDGKYYQIKNPSTNTFLELTADKKGAAFVTNPNAQLSKFMLDVPATRSIKPLTQRECEGKGLTWTEKSHGIPPPECKKGEFQRDNHLGNSNGPWDASYNWTIPDDVEFKKCTLRLRYNISTGEYPGGPGSADTNMKYATAMHDAPTDQNGKYPYPIVSNANDPLDKVRQDVIYNTTFSMGGKPVFFEMAMNTNQFGRTFQDRSYLFQIRKRPSNLPKSAKVYNLGVSGKRGNIVQTYPAHEYDFAPKDLYLNQGDYVHFQWEGSDYNPRRGPNNGEGGPPDKADNDPNKDSRADRSNIVETALADANVPHMKLGAELKDSMFSNEEDAKRMAFINQDASLCKSIEELAKEKNSRKRNNQIGNCQKLNAAEHPYFDGGVVQMKKQGRFTYFSTRNNNFSNRSQKGQITVGAAAAASKPDRPGILKIGSPNPEFVAFSGDEVMPNGDQGYPCTRAQRLTGEEIRSFDNLGECVEVHVGSGSKTKTVTVQGLSSAMICPAKVDRSNWLGGYTYPDTFKVTHNNNSITVKRTDSNNNWGMQLKFECCPAGVTAAAASAKAHQKCMTECEKYKGCAGYTFMYSGGMSNSCNLKMAGEAVSSKSTGDHHHHHHQVNRDPYMACKRATPVANGLPKPTFEYIIGTKGALSCNGTEWSMPSQTDCLEHATKALTAAGKTARRGLQVGNWGHLPWGCSVQSGGDWTPHYNRKASTRNDGGYSPVCGREVKATNEIQTGTSFLQATHV